MAEKLVGMGFSTISMESRYLQQILDTISPTTEPTVESRGLDHSLCLIEVRKDNLHVANNSVVAMCGRSSCCGHVPCVLVLIVISNQELACFLRST